MIFRLTYVNRLFLCTLAINFADYSTQVYAAYTTSAFKQHSAMSAARVVMNIARISAYPIIAKLGDVSAPYARKNDSHLPWLLGFRKSGNVHLVDFPFRSRLCYIRSLHKYCPVHCVSVQ